MLPAASIDRNIIACCPSAEATTVPVYACQTPPSSWNSVPLGPLIWSEVVRAIITSERNHPLAPVVPLTVCCVVGGVLSMEIPTV